MESSLHQQLKDHYCHPAARQEVKLGRYRIDVMDEDRLIEIQHGSLAAIRDKVAHLLKQHQVLIVKPIVARKRLIKLKCKGGAVIDQRWSPKRGKLIDLFDELVYFTRVFPHPQLCLEAVLVQVEERRFPGRGRRRRKRPSDHQVEDIRLVQIDEAMRFESVSDLCSLLPKRLPRRFHTGHLAERLNVPRWNAQRIAYCLRQMNGIQRVGKQGNAYLYERRQTKRRAS